MFTATKFIHSFILSYCFILVRVALNPEPIPGMLGVKQEYTLNGMSIAGHHAHTHLVVLACFGGNKKPENPEQAHVDPHYTVILVHTFFHFVSQVQATTLLQENEYINPIPWTLHTTELLL